MEEEREIEEHLDELTQFPGLTQKRVVSQDLFEDQHFYIIYETNELGVIDKHEHGRY